jgi:hypothetical protein
MAGFGRAPGQGVFGIDVIADQEFASSDRIRISRALGMIGEIDRDESIVDVFDITDFLFRVDFGAARRSAGRITAGRLGIGQNPERLGVRNDRDTPRRGRLGRRLVLIGQLAARKRAQREEIVGKERQCRVFLGDRAVIVAV